MKVYLDYAATSPVRPEVLEAISPYLTEKFGNPSSIHSFGQEARAAVDEAREQIAQFLNCVPSEIIFTSGGTESDNLAIMGVIKHLVASLLKRNSKPHIITSNIEHHAVLETCHFLEQQNLAEVTYVKVNQKGVVGVEDIKKAIRDNTALISIMYANNEIGSIQPIREIGKLIKRINKGRKEKIVFHTDAVQAAGWLSCDTKKLHVHLLTIAGHKIGAPKGVGVLFKRSDVNLTALTHGGAQEYGLRPGTENVAGIVGLGKAVELIAASSPATSRTVEGAHLAKHKMREAQYVLEGQMHSAKFLKVQSLRNKLAKGLLKIRDVEVNSDLENGLPNILNVSFKGVEGESILLSLDQVGIAASSGSACTSGSLEPSHVIMAICNDPIKAHSSIRFSLGQKTSEEEINYVLEKIKPIIERLRSFSPIYERKNVK